MSSEGLPDANIINWLLAFSPIAALLIVMVGFNWGGGRAGALAWLVALGVAIFRFGAGAELLSLSQGKAALLSIWVLYIIWAALFLFHVVNETGSIDTIGRGITRITRNRIIQLILLCWIFTTFLQGIAGYGVPVAIVSPLMVGLGFSPVVAVVTTSVGHSWSVTFGSLAASFFALSGVSGIEGTDLVLESAVLLGVACFLCGFGAVWAYGGLRAMWFASIPLLVIGALMAGTQLGVALLGAYSLSAFTAGCVGLVAIAGFARFHRYRTEPEASDGSQPEIASNRSVPSIRDLGIAFSAYIVLIAIVLISSSVGPIERLSESGAVRMAFPETETSYGWVNPAVSSFQTIMPFGHAGAMLLYATAIGALIYYRAGKLNRETLRTAGQRTVSGALGSSLGIVTMVGMALMMMESGMTFLLAEGIVEIAGPVFPLVSPFVGVLGSFMTGSNTNSNILFGALQRDSAVLLSLPPALLLAAQTTGGALGSMIAPAKIIVGCSTVGLSGSEGPVIKQSIRYGVVLTAIIGAVTLVWSWFV